MHSNVYFPCMQVTMQFFILIFVEAVVRWLQQKPLPRLNDSINSISNGIMSELIPVLVGAIEIMSYVWVHRNFCVINLPWNSAITWWLALLGVDFGYYWFHRMAHGQLQSLKKHLLISVFNVEVHIFWMAHQVHHSSEDYTLSTALRQSILQRYTSWVKINLHFFGSITSYY